MLYIKIACQSCFISVFFYRDGLQESAVVSKTFQVDTARDYSDDGYSFIESYDTMSTTTATTNSTSTASTVKHAKRDKYRRDNKHQVCFETSLDHIFARLIDSPMLSQI